MSRSGKLYITINRRVIDSNRKHGRRDPPIRVVKGKYGKPVYSLGHHDVMRGFRVVYSPDKPLPCGARVWIGVEE